LVYEKQPYGIEKKQRNEMCAFASVLDRAMASEDVCLIHKDI
jgi:hypothetical protein